MKTTNKTRVKRSTEQQEGRAAPRCEDRACSWLRTLISLGWKVRLSGTHMQHLAACHQRTVHGPDTDEYDVNGVRVRVAVRYSARLAPSRGRGKSAR